MSVRRRWLLAALLVALGGFAAGLVLSRGTARAQGPPGVLARGAFRAAGWGTTGEATVVRKASGDLVLRFDRHFVTEKAPDLFVYVGRYLGMHSPETKWQLAGPLYRAGGRHTFPLHSAPAAGSSVIIFCMKCDRVFGYAPLTLAGSRRD